MHKGNKNLCEILLGPSLNLPSGGNMLYSWSEWNKQVLQYILKIIIKQVDYEVSVQW